MSKVKYNPELIWRLLSEGASNDTIKIELNKEYGSVPQSTIDRLILRALRQNGMIPPTNNGRTAAEPGFPKLNKSGLHISCKRLEDYGYNVDDCFEIETREDGIFLKKVVGQEA